MFINLGFKQYEGFKTQMFHMQDVQTANRIFTSRNCTEEEKYKVEEEIKFQKLWDSEKHQHCDSSKTSQQYSSKSNVGHNNSQKIGKISNVSVGWN